MRHHRFFYCLYLLLCSTFATTFAQPNTHKTGADEGEVKVSPKCAAVLVLTGGAVGGSLTFMLSGPLLSTIGFTAQGVSAGSLAAWWQSTFPLVKAGSLFSSLQSIAMTRIPAIVFIPGSVGGTMAASKLKDICAVIDDVDEKSPAGIAITKMLKSVEAMEILAQKSVKSWEMMKQGWKDVSEQVNHQIDNIDPNTSLGKGIFFMQEGRNVLGEVVKIGGEAWESTRQVLKEAKKKIDEQNGRDV